MRESKHTEGPWIFTRDRRQLVSATERLTIMRDINWWNGNDADADLIAAAPDLLEALKKFVTVTDPACLVEKDSPHSHFADPLRCALNVIAKAEGRQP